MCTSEKLCADLQWTLNHASKFLTAAQHKPLERLGGVKVLGFSSNLSLFTYVPRVWLNQLMLTVT